MLRNHIDNLQAIEDELEQLDRAAMTPVVRLRVSDALEAIDNARACLIHAADLSELSTHTHTEIEWRDDDVVGLTPAGKLATEVTEDTERS